MSAMRRGRAASSVTGLAGLVLILAASGPIAAGAETLDRELLRQAPAVLKSLRDRGCKDVGVLKFRVKKGDEPASDRVGTLNLDLAARLEIALILADDIRDPLGIVRDASAVAATIPGADHLTREGRRALFRGGYPLAWGIRKVEPGAFLTGVVVLSPDLRTMTVAILAFGKDGEKLENIAKFDASTDTPALVGAGASFRVRGAFDGGKVEQAREATVEAAARVQSSTAEHPLRDPEAPVTLEVLYDGRPVPLEIKGGKALVREPDRGQQVTFRLSKADKADGRYGVVLLVNGENTLYRQRLNPLHAAKWVLDRGHPVTIVRGFQTGEKSAEAFRVLSRAESRKNAMDYGADAGTITLVVFRERQGREADPPLALDDEAEDLAAMARGALPAQSPQTLSALKFQLREAPTKTASRGLIVEGQAIDVPIRQLDFQPEPTPVLSATITYYRP